MSVKLTQEEIIKRFKQIHGDKYDYSKVEYRNTKSKITIICPIHGEFEQFVGAHLRGNGCNRCYKLSTRLTIKTVLERFKEIHGNSYDYSKFVYNGNDKKSIIICPKHGEFLKSAHEHFKNGCPKCGKYKKYSQEEWIQKAKEVHGNKYDYSKVKYINSITKVTIICPRHGEFLQNPNYHLLGQNCKKCAKGIMTQGEWINKASLIHNHKYNYNKTIYKDSRTKVIITCPIHGDFEQLANSHMQGFGCEKCMPQYQPKSREEWITKAKKIHGPKTYDYSKVIYTRSFEKVEIICKIHGSFWQEACSHTLGTGCPKCKTSKGEDLIYSWFNKNMMHFIPQYKFKNCIYKRSLPFDFYLPELNWCIEYDGEGHFIAIDLWGGKDKLALIQLKDSIKTQYCKDNGIKLLRIPYWDIDRIEEILEFNFGIW